MSCCPHLDGAIQVKHNIGDVVCVVHCCDAPHNKRMISHAPVLDEAAFRPKLLQWCPPKVRLHAGSTKIPSNLGGKPERTPPR